MTDTALASATTPGISKSQKTVRIVGWSALGAFLLILFSLMKLPEDRVQSYINGSIASALGAQGITFTTKSTSISYFMGVTLRMQGLTLNFPPPAAPVQIEEAEISPSLIPLIIGHVSGSVMVRQDKGSLKGSFSISSLKPPSQMSVTFKATSLNIGKLGVLSALAGIQGSAMVSGEGSLNGDFNNLATLGGEMRITADKLVVDPQTIKGLNVPKITVSTSALNATADKGKIQVKQLQIGRASDPNDDIVATLNGDMQLGRGIEQSTLNLKSQFKLSQNVMKPFFILDAFLAPGKVAENTYAFNLTGPIMSPNAIPSGK